MIDKSNKTATEEAKTVTNNTPVTSKPTTTPAPAPTPTPAPVQQTKTITVGGKINAGSAQIYEYAGDTTGARQYYRNDPIYTVLAEKNGYLKVRYHKLSSGTTGWFKKSDVKAYSTGGKIDYTGLAMVHGSKSKPELMLNAKDTQNFIQLKDTLSKVAQTNMFSKIQSYAKLPNFAPNGNVKSNGDVIFEKIEMYGVNDPQEFARQLKEVYDRDIGSVRKMITTDVHSKHGSMNYKRYI